MESATKTDISPESLAAICTSKLGRRLSGHAELKDGWFNTTYALTLDDGRRAVLKASPPDGVPVLRYEADILRSELTVMTLLRERTSIPIPAVLCVDFSRQIVPLNYYVMEWLPGQMLNAVQDSLPPATLASVRRETGHVLRQINSIQGPTYGMVANPRFQTWREAFVGFMEDVALDGEASAVRLDYDAIRRTVERHADSLDAVDVPHLVHWDLWEGNIGVVEGRISGVIDFERAFWGDPLMETNWMNATPEFVDGYGDDLRKGPAARERRLLYDLYLLSIMQIEAWYRQFTDLSGVEWAQARYAETMSALA